MSVILKYNKLKAEGNLPHIVETNKVRSRNELRQSILNHLRCVNEDTSGIGNITPDTYR